MKKQSGNALIFILIAIFLLGGLTALLSRTSGNTEETGATEQDRIAISELMTYMASIQSAVIALVQRGCSENELSFWTDTNSDGVENSSDTFYNANSPISRDCHVFFPEGAGLTYKKLPTKYFKTGATLFSPTFTGNAQISNIGKDCTNRSCNEIIASLKEVDPVFCQRINQSLGISSVPSEQIANWDYSTATVFKGSFLNSGGTANVIGNEGGNVLSGKKMGCLQRNDLGAGVPNEFYYLLLPR